MEPAESNLDEYDFVFAYKLKDRSYITSKKEELTLENYNLCLWDIANTIHVEQLRQLVTQEKLKEFAGTVITKPGEKRLRQDE